MADIDVVPKHRSYTWLWILLSVVIVALIVWALAGRSHPTAELQGAQPSIASMNTSDFSFTI